MGYYRRRNRMAIQPRQGSKHVFQGRPSMGCGCRWPVSSCGFADTPTSQSWGADAGHFKLSFTASRKVFNNYSQALCTMGAFLSFESIHEGLLPLYLFPFSSPLANHYHILDILSRFNFGVHVLIPLSIHEYQSYITSTAHLCLPFRTLSVLLFLLIMYYVWCRFIHDHLLA